MDGVAFNSEIPQLAIPQIRPIQVRLWRYDVMLTVPVAPVNVNTGPHLEL